MATAAEADVPLKYGWLAACASTNEASHDARFVALARTMAPRFDFHDGIANPRLVDRFVAGLGGPPDPVRIVDDRYLVLGACVPHDCGSKSFLWIDRIDGARIGAVAGVGYADHRTVLTVFSRSIDCARIPPAFVAALSQWTTANAMVVVASGFVGRDGRRDEHCLADIDRPSPPRPSPSSPTSSSRHE